MKTRFIIVSFYSLFYGGKDCVSLLLQKLELDLKLFSSYCLVIERWCNEASVFKIIHMESKPIWHIPGHTSHFQLLLTVFILHYSGSIQHRGHHSEVKWVICQLPLFPEVTPNFINNSLKGSLNALRNFSPFAQQRWEMQCPLHLMHRTDKKDNSSQSVHHSFRKLLLLHTVLKCCFLVPKFKRDRMFHPYKKLTNKSCTYTSHNLQRPVYNILYLLKMRNIWEYVLVKLCQLL